MNAARTISTSAIQQASRLGIRDRIVALGRALRHAQGTARDQTALMLIELAAQQETDASPEQDRQAAGPIELITRIPGRWRARHADDALLALARGWKNLSPEVRPLALALGRDRWIRAARALGEQIDPEARLAALAIAYDSADPGLGKVVCRLLSDETQSVRKAADETLLRMALRLMTHLPPPLLGSHYARIARLPVDALPAERRVIELERCVLLGAISDAAWGFAGHRCRSPLVAALLLMDRAVATPLERDIATRMRRLLSERNHPSHAPLRSVLKRTDCPLLRERALRWLPIDAIATASLERLCSAESITEHEIVLSKAPLALRPKRAERLAGLSRVRSAVRGVSMLPDRSDWGALSESARVGVIALSRLIGEDDSVMRTRIEPALADPSSHVRLASAAMCPPLDLQDYLFDSDPVVARHAANRWSTLGIDPPRPGSPAWSARVRLCERNTRSPHAFVRRLAGEELARLTMDDASHPASRQRARRLYESDPAGFTRAVRDRLSDPARCDEAIALIRALGVERRFELDLIGIVQSENQRPRARASAVAALARVQTNAARYVLSEALSDRDARTRANAIEAIDIEPKRLLEYKDDAEHRVRANAVRRLIIDNKEREPGVQQAAAESLLQLLRDPRPTHRLAGAWVAQRTLSADRRERLGKAWRPVVALLEEIAAVDQDPRLRERASRCIRRLSAEIRARAYDPLPAAQGEPRRF